MVIRWLLIVFVCVFGALLLCVSTSTAMTPGCSSIEEKPITYDKYAMNFLQWGIRE